ncbi:MAG: glycosyltransferase family 87 protein [Candidatus Dormiibacterota bacterium]
MIRLSAGAITAAGIWTYAISTLFLSQKLQPMGDFDAYYRAASDLNHNLDPYLRYNHHLAFSLSVGYIYPPFFARLLQPLALLSLDQAHVVALVVLQLSVLASVVLTWHLLGVSSWTARLFTLDAFLLSSGLVANLEAGNLNVVLVPLSLAWVLAYRRAAQWGWFFVGLNVGLKLQQAPLLALALFRREWRGLGLATATLLATVLVGGLALTYEFLTTVLPRLTNTVPTGAQNTSLLADFERMLHPGADNLYYDPTYPEARFFLFTVVLVVLFFSARALSGLADRHLEALIALAAVPLLNNYLGAPHLLLLLPVGLLLAARALRFRAWFALAMLAVSLFFVAEYPVLYTLVTTLNYFVARAVFYEIAPGLAALCIWLVSLRLGAYTKALPLAASASLTPE